MGLSLACLSFESAHGLQHCSFGFIFLTKSKSCRYLSICWRENHPSSDHIRQLICLIWLFFFNRFSIQCFSYHDTAKQRSTKTVYICLWGPRARYPAAAAVMGSGWTPNLVSMTYESAAWVQCHLRISWTGLHISKTPCSAGQIAVLLLLNPTPYISSALQLTLNFTVFVFFYYMLCLFFHSQLWGHKGKKIIMCEDGKKKFFLKERHFSEFMNVSHYFWHLIQF